MKHCILLVFPGLGKTYSAKNFKNVEDIRLSIFENLNVERFDSNASEKLKGSEMEMDKNPNFPHNLINFLNKTLKSNKIPVMALKQTNINFLIENNFNFAFVVPAKDKLDELKQQYVKRGNSDLVVERNINSVNKILKEIPRYSKKCFYIHKGEHLQDLINTLYYNTNTKF